MKAWRGEFDASKPGPMCPQPFQPTEVQSEDCLRINVYSKEVGDY